jgi:hypothetical protein
MSDEQTRRQTCGARQDGAPFPCHLKRGHMGDHECISSTHWYRIAWPNKEGPFYPRPFWEKRP